MPSAFYSPVVLINSIRGVRILQNPDTSDRVDKNNRRIKSARHDNSGSDKTRPLPNINGVVGDPEWRAGFSDLPVASSDLIVEAVVSESHAFLSNDKTGV